MSKSETGILGKIADLLLKIRTPFQLSGLVIFAVVYLLTRSSRSNIVDTFAGFGILLILFGQVFGLVEKVPAASRAALLLGCLALGTISFAILIVHAFEPSGTSKSDDTPHYRPAEQRLVDLRSQMDQVRSSYVVLSDQPDQMPDVNRNARHLAERLGAVDDADLGPAIQIFKYEGMAYSWAMVAGSESDSEAKLKAVDEILRATDKGKQLINDVRRSGPYDQHIQNWRDWIINDNAPERLQRLSAIALCTRWGVKKNNKDRLEVRRIIVNLPNDYRVDEHPEGSVRPCLSDDENGQIRKIGRVVRSEKEEQ